MITQVEQQTIDALQKLHELIQQNSSEDAGYCWHEFLEDFARSCGRVWSPEGMQGAVRSAFRSNDFNPKDFGL